MNKTDFKNYINIIYKIVEYYRTNGDNTFSEIEIKSNFSKEELYELIDFFENYIINYNLYVYDMLSQELFLKLMKGKKIHHIEEILESKLVEIKKNINNIEIIKRIEYIIANSYKINNEKRLSELVTILKNLKVKNLDDIENLIFMINKINKIKENKYNKDDLKEILKFVSKFDGNNKSIKDDIKELILDYENINNIFKKYPKEIEEIKKNNIIDKVINYLDTN